MKEGKTMEGAFFVAACVVFVLASFLYLKRENTDYKKFAEAAEDLRGGLADIQTSQKTILEQYKAFTDTTVIALGDLTRRLTKLEKEQVANAAVDENRTVKVDIVNWPQKFLPPKSKTALLKRAGILPKENN